MADYCENTCEYHKKSLFLQRKNWMIYEKDT